MKEFLMEFDYEYKDCKGKVNFDEGLGIFHGEVLGLVAIVTFQGSTLDELKRAFQESIDDYLDMMSDTQDT